MRNKKTLVLCRDLGMMGLRTIVGILCKECSRGCLRLRRWRCTNMLAAWLWTLENKNKKAEVAEGRVNKETRKMVCFCSGIICPALRRSLVFRIDRCKRGFLNAWLV